MKILNKTLLLVFIACTVVFPSDAKQLLNNIREKFNSINDFSAEIKQDGDKNFFNGKIFYKKENKIRFEGKNTTIVSDGTVVWNHNRKEKKVVISELDPKEGLTLSLNTLLNEYPSKSEIATETEGNYDILILTPKPGSGLKFNTARLWINKENLIERVSIKDQQGTTEFRITDYRINQNLKDSRFQFDVPEGNKVIDLR